MIRTGKLIGAAALLLALLVGAAVLLTGSQPLRTAGPTAVAGTTASDPFTIGEATIRHVRYADRTVLRYSFTLVNTSLSPLRVVELAPHQRRATSGAGTARGAGPKGSGAATTRGAGPKGRGAGTTLLRPRSLSPVTVGPRARHRVTLRLLMTDCERLSARAGSVLTTLRVRVRVLGLFPRTVTVPLHERLRVGSAREAGCPRATSASRPPG